MAEKVGVDPGQLRRVAVASSIGTTIEWYDFFIFSTAVPLVFNTQFFSTLSPASGTLAGFATLGVGIIARPVGGVLWGHFGDRVGRKAMLVASLVLMGAATVGVGLLPTYAQIGVLAPILLVVMRLLQGVSAGGEWGGAALMAVEHAPPGKRGAYGSFSQVGVPAGLILAQLAVHRGHRVDDAGAVRGLGLAAAVPVQHRAGGGRAGRAAVAGGEPGVRGVAERAGAQQPTDRRGVPGAAAASWCWPR